MHINMICRLLPETQMPPAGPCCQPSLDRGREESAAFSVEAEGTEDNGGWQICYDRFLHRSLKGNP